MKAFVINTSILIVTLVTASSVAEITARQLLPPIDYLLPQVIEDPILNHRIAPKSGGHDDWGFRNTALPESSSIVAIGDSMTYGMEATSQNAWPKQLETMTELSVYNMGLGGYGPLQYRYLFEEKALRLDPHTVIVAFYLGNDILDAFSLATTKPHWRHYRSEEYEGSDEALIHLELNVGPQRAFAGLRQWLAERSVLYRATTQSVLGQLAREREVAMGEQMYLEITVREESIRFMPGDRYSSLNLDDPRIEEGLLITLRAIDEINQLALSASVRLIIALVPTKEAVYESELTAQQLDSKWDYLYKLIDHEHSVRQRVIDHLERGRIEYLDLLPSLKQQRLERALYPPGDDHPNRFGYRVIAESLKDEYFDG